MTKQSVWVSKAQGVDKAKKVAATMSNHHGVGGGNSHPQAIGTVMAVLQGAYTDFLKGVSRPSAQSSSSCVAGACALVDASRAAPGWASESERFRVDDPSRRGSHFF